MKMIMLAALLGAWPPQTVANDTSLKAKIDYSVITADHLVTDQNVMFCAVDQSGTSVLVESAAFYAASPIAAYIYDAAKKGGSPMASWRDAVADTPKWGSTDFIAANEMMMSKSTARLPARTHYRT